MKYIKNNKGFTLVELLAVIVILALIMGIAAYSMSGVIGNVEISSMKSSAASYVEGLRKMLLVNMDLAEGDYYISDKMLEKSVSSPWGEYVYKDTAKNSASGYSKAGATGTLKCGSNGDGSFVRVTKDASGNYTYAICLYDDAKNYIFASEEILNKSSSESTDYYYTGDATELYVVGGKVSTTNS